MWHYRLSTLFYGVCLRSKPLAIIAVTYGIVSLFLRLILWWIFGRDAGITITHLPAILGLGIINDLLELVYLFAPLTLLLLILPPRWLKKDFMIRLTGIAFYLLLFGFLYLQAVEFFFFDEFDSRFNLIAVDYLMYPNEVFINLWESYPVVWFLFGFLILTTAVYNYCGHRSENPFKIILPTNDHGHESQHIQC